MLDFVEIENNGLIVFYKAKKGGILDKDDYDRVAVRIE